MRSIVNLFLVVFVAVAVISCKDNASKAADATAEAATAQGVEYTLTPETAKVTWEGSKPTGKHVGTVNVAKGIFTVKDGSGCWNSCIGYEYNYCYRFDWR